MKRLEESITQIYLLYYSVLLFLELFRKLFHRNYAVILYINKRIIKINNLEGWVFLIGKQIVFNYK